jgi:hypothetical protein
MVCLKGLLHIDTVKLKRAQECQGAARVPRLSVEATSWGIPEPS